jgi:hypothetical protein
MASRLIAEPGPRISLELSQFTHHTKRIWTTLRDGPPVGSQEQIGEFQSVFDKPDFAVNPLNRRRRLPGPFLMAPIIRVDQRWALSLMEAGTIDHTSLLLKQKVTNLV